MSQDSFSSSSSKGFTANSGGLKPPTSSLPSLDDLDIGGFELPVDTRPAPPAPPAEELAGFGRDSLPAPAAAPPADMTDTFLASPIPEAPAAEETVEAASAVPAGNAWETILHDEFQSKDRNGDGFLSMKEITIKELLELDVDHNGFISIEEFYAVFERKSEAAFKKMDLDRDGRLLLAEFAKGTPTPALEAAYGRYAANPAAGLSLDEYRNYLAEQRGPKR